MIKVSFKALINFKNLDKEGYLPEEVFFEILELNGIIINGQEKRKILRKKECLA